MRYEDAVAEKHIVLPYLIKDTKTGLYHIPGMGWGFWIMAYSLPIIPISEFRLLENLEYVGQRIIN